METSSARKKAIALLRKYKAGLCTPEETNRIMLWYNSFKDSSAGFYDKDVVRAADEAAYQVLTKLFGTQKT